jgi:hypothetical protein
MSRIPSRNFRRFASQPAQESTVVPDSTIKEQFLPKPFRDLLPCLWVYQS